MTQATHWKCSVCDKQITHYDESEENIDNEVIADIHFDIERSRKDLTLDYDDSIKENIEERNVKMDRMLCEDCFNKILSESPTLKKIFLMDNKILY